MELSLRFLPLLYSAVLTLIANSFVFIQRQPAILWILIPAFLLINIFAGIFQFRTARKQQRVCYHGTVLLLAFCVCAVTSAVYQIHLAISASESYMTCFWSLIQCIGVLFVVFWNGIICVYLTSTQLGLRLRIVGLVFGFVPVINLIILFFILRTTCQECQYEARKDSINRKRAPEMLCATKYPILMVHGVFFRDFRYFNYWGRIPKELEVNGAVVFYGNHHSAASIADSAAELKMRIREILHQTGAKKLNIIAHSKGGLDCRYAIAKLGLEDCVASLTTVNTPHRGCLFADYLLKTIPLKIQKKVANTYNSTLKKLGDTNPDFLAAVTDLTAARCQQLDSEFMIPEGIFCQSVGSVMAKAKGGKFPLNYSYHLVKHFDGENDGLVSEKSFQWGERYLLIRPTGKRGISHGDMIDLNRENLKGFDVREFYVTLVNDLKNRGL